MASGSVIGALRVNLGLDSAKFQNGLKTSQTSMQRFAQQAKLAAAAAAAAFGVALVGMTRSGLEFVDSQAKTARALDATIDGLRAVQIVASDTGVSVDQVGSEIAKMGKRFAEAARDGTGPAHEALEMLGLRASDLMAMDVDERLATIADRVQELGLNAQQTGDLLRQFGVRNENLALTLLAGGDAFRAAREEVDALGLSLSEVDAAKVEEANDAWSRISFATESLSNRLAVSFAPAMEAIANAFVRAMQEGGALRVTIEALGDNIGRIASTAAAFAAFMAGRFAISIGVAAVAAVASLTVSLTALRALLLRSFFGAIIIGAGELIFRFGLLVKETGSVGNALKLLKDVALEVWQRIGDGVDFITQSVAAMADNIVVTFTNALRVMAGKWVEFTWAIADGLNSLFATNLSGASAIITQELAAAQLAAQRAADAHRDAATAAADRFTAPLESLQKLNDVVADTVDETEALEAESREAAAALEEAGRAAENAGGGGKRAMAGLKDEIAEVNAVSQEWRDTLREGFIDLTARGQGFGDVLLGISQKLQEMAAANLFDAIFPTTASVGGDFIGALFGGSVGANANGTPNWTGGLTRVNERGGEIIDLPSGSRIVPHDLSRGMMDRVQVEVIGGDLTLTDDGTVATQIQITAAQAGAGAVETVKRNLDGWQSALRIDGAVPA